MGEALARRLHKDGWKVAGIARNGEKLEKLAGELDGLWTKSIDATDAEALKDAVEEAAGEMGGLGAYAHLVGSIFLKPAHLTSVEEWSETIRLNLDSAFYGVRAATGLMQKGSDGGSIVLVSTGAARKGLSNHESIAAAKAGIEGLARSAAATYAMKQIRVNVVAPGMTETPMAEPIIGNEKGRLFSERMHPLGRLGQPDEVAAMIAFLLREDAQFITGQTIGVDGGLATLGIKPKV